MSGAQGDMRSIELPEMLVILGVGALRLIPIAAIIAAVWFVVKRKPFAVASRQCGHCGQRVPDIGNFCLFCGQKIS